MGLVYLQSCGSAGRIKQGLFTQHLSLHNTQLLPNLNFSFTACPSSDPSFHFPVLTSYPECLLSGIFLFAARLLCPQDFPGKNTGIDYHFLLQRIFASQGSNPRLPNFLHWHGDLLQLSHLGSLTSYPRESLTHN